MQALLYCVITHQQQWFASSKKNVSCSCASNCICGLRAAVWPHPAATATAFLAHFSSSSSSAEAPSAASRVAQSLHRGLDSVAAAVDQQELFAWMAGGSLHNGRPWAPSTFEPPIAFSYLLCDGKGKQRAPLGVLQGVAPAPPGPPLFQFGSLPYLFLHSQDCRKG